MGGNHDTTFTDTDLLTEREGSDRVLRAMADERRRVALAYLSRADEPVTFDDLVSQLVERDVVARSETTDDRTERVATTLVHRHLPALEAASLVSYDPEAAVVESLVDPADLEELVALFPPHEE